MAWFQGGTNTYTDVSPTPPPPTDAEKQAYFDYIRQFNPAEYEKQKFSDPKWVAEQQAAAVASASGSAPNAASAPPTGPEVALQQLNDALGPDFERQYLPDTLDDPFVNAALGTQRSKADTFISNMLSRGTLGEAGRANAIKALDTQVPSVTSRLTDVSTALLNADRSRLTDLANTKRAQAQGTPVGTAFDPTPLVNEIASTGQGYASSFGDRFNAGLPAGDLFDTSGLAAAGGGVASPQNVSFDPYAVEGGKLSTGLDDQNAAPAAAGKKRRTSVF